MIEMQSRPTEGPPSARFAEPDWRGEQDRAGEPAPALRPLASLSEQERLIEDWILGGSCYGWLNAYEARRAAFELQSIRAQRQQGALDPSHRRALQSRLDRLEGVLNCARSALPR
jgi:hypothetical protein